MPLAFSLPATCTDLPLHARLMLAVVLMSALACLAVVAVGAIQRRRYRYEGLPPLPASFPHTCDQVGTAIFMCFILWGAVANLLPAEAAPAAADTAPRAFGWGALLAGLALQTGIYLPMLVRYGILHPWQPPTRPWRHYLALPVLVWAGIYLTIVLLDTGGFTTWLIRKTGCPEHQELVLLFSRGEALQRLYIILGAVVIAPIAEECCFRGFLYTSLRRWGGCAAATVASALLFGAIHASLAQMLPLTLFGIVQCIAYEKVRSLWLPIAVHMLFNSSSLIATALTLP